MSPQEVRRSRVADWLTAHQGARTQDDYAADITAATGWKIDRTRLGRYMSGKLSVGPEVLGHLAEYARLRNLPPIDLHPPEPERSPEERAALAAERQAIAAERQAAAAEAQTVLMAQLVAHITGSTPVDPGASDRVAAFLATVAARQPAPGNPATPPA